jgi:hypothetical protein
VGFTPAATLRVARVRHAGNCDPEPLAWRRLALLAARRERIKLVVSPPIPATELSARRWPVAAITGTEAFELSKAERASLTNYLAAGGTLVADAAGGSKAFADAVTREIVPLVGGGVAERLARDHAIYGRLGGKVRYRRDFARVLGGGASAGRLRGVVDETGRLAVIFSGDDITGGLVGYPCHKLRGYAPETSVALMLAILKEAARIGKPPATTRPAAPASKRTARPTTRPASPPAAAPTTRPARPLMEQAP